MKKELTDRCECRTPKMLGTKRRWRLMPSPDTWTCSCGNGCKIRRDLTIEGVDKTCEFCGKDLIAAQERTTYFICRQCNKEL